MKRAAASLLILCLTTFAVAAQEQRESLGDAARRIRAEKARERENAQPHGDVTFDEGTINAARLYEKGMNTLREADRKDNAVSLIRSAAALNYAPAQVTMGYFAETSVPAERAQAAEWYRRAAEQGDPLARWLLGRMYITGNGVAQSMEAARDWLFPVAEAGNPFAQYLIALTMDEHDRDIAAEWLRRSAEQGLPQARKKYGTILHYGRGVEMNRYQAYVWLTAGTLEGDTSTKEELSELADSLGESHAEKAKMEAGAKATRADVAKGCTGWPGEFDEIPAPPPPELQKYCR